MSLTDGSITDTPRETDTFPFTITATNIAGSVESDFNIKINESSSGEEPAPGQDPDPELPHDPELEPVPGIVVGRARGISSLNAYDIDALSNDESMIAAILPELTVNTSDSYIFRNVAIDSNVPTGLPLVWNGFASGSDNSHAEFFDANGVNISTVPRDHVINITAYLEAGKTYAPVITATLPQNSNTDSRPENKNSSFGGGGGCDSGLAGMMILVVCYAALRKK